MINQVKLRSSMNWFTFLATFCLAFVQPCLTSICQETASSTGTHFMFGVPYKASGINGSGFIHFTSQSFAGARVTVKIPFIHYNHQFTLYDTLTLPLPKSLVQNEFGRKSKGVEIVSDKSIAVAVELNYLESTEGFLVLSTSALSTRYVAASYMPKNVFFDAYPNSILIVGIENDTYAQINYTENGQRVVLQTGRLQKFDTYQLLVYYEDLSGAVITSNKPVAVISSSPSSQIPVNACTFNFIVEQMIPTKYWTNKYIVAPIYTHELNIVRVFADRGNTAINYYNHTHHLADNLSQGDMKEIPFGYDPLVIIADKPISVMQYAASKCNGTKEGWYKVERPLMITSQGISQYTNTYFFFNPQPYRVYTYLDEPNFLVITVQQNATGGISLNGMSLSNWNVTTAPVSPPFADYVTLYVNVTHNSSFQLEHRQGVKFGAFIYGFTFYDSAFGYPLQLKLSSSECQAQPDLSLGTTHTPGPDTSYVTSLGLPSQGPSSATSSVKHTPDTTTHYVQQMTEPGQMYTSTSFVQSTTGNRTWCFACDGILHLKYCDTVRPCNTETEVCYVTRYAKSSSLQVYSTGCMEKDMCTIAGPSVDCQTCCAGSFCNTAGCGDTGLPDKSDRGPMCFACDHLGENDICQTVHMCAPGQVCKIEKHVWGKEFSYSMDCSDQRLCHSKRYVTPFKKRSTNTLTLNERSTPVCLNCCHDDFCNMNCTSTHQTPLIG